MSATEAQHNWKCDKFRYTVIIGAAAGKKTIYLRESSYSPKKPDKEGSVVYSNSTS